MESLLKSPPHVARHTPPNEAPQFIALLQQRHLVDDPVGGKIATSLDLDLQKLAMRALRDHLSATAGLGVGDAAIVVIENSTGLVRALACAGRLRHSGSK